MLAKLRFVADSTNMSLWGSNTIEQELIDKIKREYGQYIFHDPPLDILRKAKPMLDILFADHKLDERAAMYDYLCPCVWADYKEIDHTQEIQYALEIKKLG
jgi:hypothetical protein